MVGLDEQLIPQNLPKRIYDDCMKEEPEMVAMAGEFFGKLCGNTAMRLARNIVLKGEKMT